MRRTARGTARRTDLRAVPEEEVLLDLRPHGNRLVLPVAALLVVLGLTGYGLAATTGAARAAVVAAALLVLLPLAVRPYLRWLGARLVLTDRRLVLRSGLLSRTGRVLPLSAVEDVLFRRSLRERLVGRGTLVVEQREGPELRVPHLRWVEEVARSVRDELR